MPVYEYRCRSCGSTFEARRPMSESNAPIPCPDGHDGAVRVLSAFASITSSPGGTPAPSGGAPCGAHCACH